MVPLASMGDIAFLLIIFFIVAGNFIKNPVENLTLAEALEIDKVTESALTVSINGDQQLFLNGQEFPDVESLGSSIQAFLAGKESRQARTVQLRVDRDVPHSVFSKVFQAIAEANGIIQAVGEKGTGNNLN